MINPFSDDELNAPVKGTWRYRISGFDQYVNSLIGGGNNDQTFSARCWEAENKIGGRWVIIRKVVDMIFWFEKYHCHKSFWVDPLEQTYPEIDFIHE